jgi:hypothetical protein
MQSSVATTFTYRNDTARPIVVFVEPWGADYTAMPGQQLRVLAQGEGDARPHFELHQSEDGVQLWCESSCAYEVFMDGIEVECGHNRRSPRLDPLQHEAGGAATTLGKSSHTSTYFLTIESGDVPIVERVPFADYADAIDACSSYYEPNARGAVLTFSSEVRGKKFLRSYASLTRPEDLGVDPDRSSPRWRRAAKDSIAFLYSKSYTFLIESEAGAADTDRLRHEDANDDSWPSSDKDCSMQELLYSALLGSLQEMPVYLRHALGGLAPEVLLRKPVNDKSHLLEHLWHTRDCDDDLYGLRIRRILAEDRPSLEPVDVNAWPQDRGYESRSGDQAIAEFETGRANLLAELKGLSPEQLARVGIRADGSEVSVLDIIQQLALHDQDHRWRITAILRGFAGLAAPAQG